MNKKGIGGIEFVILMTAVTALPFVAGLTGFSLDRDDYNVTRDTQANPAQPEWEYCEANPIKC